MAGALFAPMTPGPSVLFRIGSLSTISNRWSRCPGVAAVKLKEAHSPLPLRRAPDKEPPGARESICFRAFHLASLNAAPTTGRLFVATKGKRTFEKPLPEVF